MADIRIHTRLSRKDYVSAVFLLTYRKPAVIILTIISGLWLLVPLLYLLGLPLYDHPPYFQLAIAVTFSMLLPLSVYRSALKAYRSNRRLQEQMVYSFNEAQMTIRGESFFSELGWEQTHKIVALKNCILIYQSANTANFIPVAAFGDQLPAFRALIRSKPFLKATL